MPVRQYETLVVFHPDLLEEGVRAQIERFRGILSGEGATVREVAEWGLRDLSYPVGKQHRGHYVLFEYDAEANAVRELERNLRLADEVLRFVSVRQVRTARPAPPPRPRRPVEEEPAELAEEAEEDEGGDQMVSE